MRNVRLIAAYEYWRHVRRRSFVFTAVGLPLLIATILAIIFAVVTNSTNEQQIGVVDQAGLIVLDNETDADASVLTAYADETAARAALDADTIDAYVVIPADYIATGEVRAVGRARLNDSSEDELRDRLEQGLLASVPAAQRDRAEDPVNLTLRTLDSNREFGDQSAILLFLLPYALALLFVICTFTTSGYLLQAITEEKENRTIELLATTVSPTELMVGKIVGLAGVGLTQVLLWALFAVVGFFAVAGRVNWLSGVQLPWSILLLSIVYFVLGYLLIAACYALLGAAVTTPQEAQPLIAPISLAAVAPLIVFVVIVSQPNGLVATILSFVPFSTAMTMLMRLPLADVPAWQIVATLLLLAASAFAAMWLAARVMRVGMLRYGKRLSVREVFGG